MKKIILICLLVLVITIGLPHPADAQRQAKTIGFFLGQYLNSTAGTTFASDIRSPQPVHFNKTIYLPEENINIENAWVEISAVLTNTTAVNVVNVSVIFNGTEVSPALLKAPFYYLSGVAENRPIYIFANVTNILRNFTDASRYTSANVSIAINGPNSNQHNAVLWVTYSYNDNSTEQLNTVIYPIYTYNTTVAAGQAIAIPFSTSVPENNSIFSQWASLYGWVDCATATDARVDATINGTDFDSKQLYLTCGSTASYGWNYLLNLTGMNFTLNTNNTLHLNTSKQAFETLGGEIFVTYNYTATAAANPIMTKTVAYYLAQSDVRPGITNQTYETMVYFPENSTNVTQVWAHITAGWVSATASAIDINATVNGNAVTKVRYQLNAPGVSTGQNTIIYNLTEAKSQLVNGTRVRLGTTYRGPVASADTISAILYVTYTYAATSVSQQKTIQSFVYNAPNTANITVSTFDLKIPEDYIIHESLFVQTIAMSNATTIFNITSNISNGRPSSTINVTFNSAGVGRTVSLLNNDTNRAIIGNGTYNITNIQTKPQLAAQKSGAAFINKIYFTYITTADVAPPTASSIQTNQSAKQNDWINLSTHWTDNNKLAQYWFSVNISGADANSTLFTFPNRPTAGHASNLTKITARPGTIVYWYAYANDTASNAGTSGVQSFTVNPGLRFNSTFGNNITGLTRSSIAVGDINNDELYDFVLMGMNLSSKLPVTEVYINKGTDLIRNSSWDVNMTKLGSGALALADFDNDGRLDLIQTGQNDSAGNPGRQIYVYTNNGTAFVQNRSWFGNLSAIINGSIGVGDIDNDGKIDAVISGTAKIQVGTAAKNQALTQTYINNGTGLAFNRSWNVNLSNLNSSSIMLADFDNDTKLDLLLAGKSGVTNFTNVYTNNGTSFAYNSSYGINLSRSSTTSLAFADINNDGLLDAVQLIAQGAAIARVYLNNGTALTENRSWALNLTATNFGGGTLGDINNDGWIDLVTQGLTNTVIPAADTQVFISNRTGFWNNVPYESELTNSSLGDVSLADFTNDSDLDLITTGQSNSIGGLNHTRIYTNDIHLNNTNTKPSPPTILDAMVAPTNIMFYWNSGSDAETPAPGLYYNLRVGTCSGCHDIVSGVYGGSGPAADGLFGNMQKRQQVTIFLSTAIAYFWSVQTIDSGRAASAFSVEQTTSAFADTIAPTASDIQLNQSAGVKRNDWVNFSAVWSDNYKLYTYWFSINQSSNPNVNSSSTTFPAQITSGAASNITRITANPGQPVSWQLYANDTTNNTGNTGWQNFTVQPAFRFNTTFGNNITGISRSSIAVGDINNDGLLDMVLMGMNITNRTPIAMTNVFINTGTNLARNTSWEVNITPLGNGALALADFDRDGLLDLIQTGQNDSAANPGRVIFVYSNNGTTFVQNRTWYYNLTPVVNGSIGVGDLDGNGTLDVIIAGTTKGLVSAAVKNFALTRAYLNNGSTLYYSRDYTVNLTNVNSSSILVVDFDNDTRLDVALAGISQGPGAVVTNATAIYLNNGTGLSHSFIYGKNITRNFPAVLGSADIDNDGRMDLTQFSGDRLPEAIVYVNNGTNLVENQSWSVNISATTSAETVLGDINNDGWIDLFSSGVSSNLIRVQAYLSNQSSFVRNVPYESELIDFAFGDAALADFANDSDLDLITTGQSNLAGGLNFTRVYTNDIHLNNTNAKPSPPTAFSSANATLNITFYWGAGSDTETPTAGLYYNLKVGTCGGCQDVVSGVMGGSGPESVMRFGNMQKRQSVTLTVPTDVAYYWSVQTIDAELATSAYSIGQTYSPIGADTARPLWENQTQNATEISQLESVGLMVQGFDATNLTYATLITNETGAWKNITDGQYGSPLKLGGNNSWQNFTFSWFNNTMEGGQSIGWYVMLNDSVGNTNTTFIQNFTLLKTISIKINNTAMNFSELQPGQSNESRPVPGWNPMPFLLYNDGNFAANITIGAANLFQKAVNPSSYFMFNSSENKTGTVRAATVELVQAYTNMPPTGSAVMVANMTNFTTNKNQINVNINITIPTNEPPTGKLATITFTASQAY